MRARGAVLSHLVLRLLDVLHVPQIHTRRLRVAQPTGSHSASAINEAKKHRLKFGFQESGSGRKRARTLCTSMPPAPPLPPSGGVKGKRHSVMQYRQTPAAQISDLLPSYSAPANISGAMYLIVPRIVEASSCATSFANPKSAILQVEPDTKTRQRLRLVEHSRLLSQTSNGASCGLRRGAYGRR